MNSSQLRSLRSGGSAVQHMQMSKEVNTTHLASSIRFCARSPSSIIFFLSCRLLSGRRRLAPWCLQLTRNSMTSSLPPHHSSPAPPPTPSPSPRGPWCPTPALGTSFISLPRAHSACAIQAIRLHRAVPAAVVLSHRRPVSVTTHPPGHLSPFA